MKYLGSKISVARNIPFDKGEVKLDKEQIKKVYQRDKGRCLYCGWQEQSVKMLRFVSTTSQYTDEVSHSKIASACIICHQLARLTYSGNAGLGQLMYCPEISQKDINHLARLYFSVKGVEGNHLDNYIILTQYFEERIRETSIYLNIKSYNLLDFASSLVQLDDELYNKRGEIFSDLRYWPNLNALNKITGQNWNYIAANTPEENWPDLKNQIKLVSQHVNSHF
jgi:hypothetical protein